ncbi:class I adenylate-forming enzyme family protein [Gordonia amicalis]|uniref:class I adenylate-forming enzyme family protein n=1 Tax=Gordonia amicalis TaxID=89053 RepID=UPI0022B36599|nr:AMP-binding protein [Gordonia amicalis]MCZ4578766.1 AMP-binding protein [Gordonia amicalis]
MPDLAYLPWHLAEQHGSAPALADERTELSFTEFDARSAALAAQLRALGLGRGDVLAIKLPNRVELVVAIAAAWRLGAAATPINPAFTDTEADHQVSDSGARLIISVDGSSPTSGVAGLAVDELATELPDEQGPLAPAPVAGADTALLIYTSGSTGRPKGVQVTHANVDAMSAPMAEHFSLTADDHCMLILPLFHANALMVSTFAPLRAGARLTIRTGFSASRFFDDVETLRPTYFSAVPTIFAVLTAMPPEVRPDTSSLRFAICGAAPVSRELLDACQTRYGLRLVEGYGLTEGTCASACNPVDGVRKLGTVGPALPRQRIRIVDADGHDVPTGETGEVIISGPTVMAGYLNNPEATAETIRDGWLHTGDIGRLDADGYLQIVDRIKDMIIRGGENLYPKEIESTIAQLPGVLESAVVGRPHEVLGEEPVAYVVRYPDSQLTADDVLAHCAGHLTRVKVPAEVTILDELPKNPVGKIDKPSLRRGLAVT